MSDFYSNMLSDIQSDIWEIERNFSPEEFKKVVDYINSLWVKDPDFLREEIAEYFENIWKWEIWGKIITLITSVSFVSETTFLDLQEFLSEFKYKTSKTKWLLLELLDAKSNFAKSVASKMEKEGFTESLSDYIYHNSFIELEEWKLLACSKIKIESWEKSIDLTLSLEDLEYLKNSIQDNIDDLQEEKKKFEKSKNFTIFN